MIAFAARPPAAVTPDVPLGDVIRFDCLAILREVAKDVGAAAQTLAAVRILARKTGRTFASVDVIADRACLPRATVQRHLAKLVVRRWIRYEARRGRRTPTYSVPTSVLNAEGREKFWLLPRWSAKLLPTWGERLVFALVVSRHSLNEFIGDDNAGESFGRLTFSIAKTALECGLAESTIVSAKTRLKRSGLIEVEQTWGCGRQLGDSVFLNAEFLVPGELVGPPPEMRLTYTENEFPSTPILRLSYTENDACSELNY